MDRKSVKEYSDSKEEAASGKKNSSKRKTSKELSRPNEISTAIAKTSSTETASSETEEAGASIQKLTKYETSKKEPSKKKSQVGNSPVKKSLDSSYVESDGDEEKTWKSEKLLKKYLWEAGIHVKSFKQLWEGCKSYEMKREKVTVLLKEKGLTGELTLKNCKALRKMEDHVKIARLKECFDIVGIKIDYEQIFEDCTSLDSMKEKLVSIWQQNDLEGDPTISNSRKIAAEKEGARKKYINMELQVQSELRKKSPK